MCEKLAPQTHKIYSPSPHSPTPILFLVGPVLDEVDAANTLPLVDILDTHTHKIRCYGADEQVAALASQERRKRVREDRKSARAHPIGGKVLTISRATLPPSFDVILVLFGSPAPLAGLALLLPPLGASRIGILLRHHRKFDCSAAAARSNTQQVLQDSCIAVCCATAVESSASPMSVTVVVVVVVVHAISLCPKRR